MVWTFRKLGQIGQNLQKDDITAFREINKNRRKQFSLLNDKKLKYRQNALILINELSHLKVAVKISSKQFGIHVVMSCLRNHFVHCRQFEKDVNQLYQ